MYLLRLRRTETIVPSTLLWQRLAADVEANAPWQRLRRSLLFLLQLLLVVDPRLPRGPAVPRAAGRPRPGPRPDRRHVGEHGRDRRPARPPGRRARRPRSRRSRTCRAGGKVSVIEAGRTARIVATGHEPTWAGSGRRSTRSGRPSSRGDLGDALALAQQLAVQSGDAEVLVATDAALAVPPTTKVDAPIRVLRVGDAKGSRNQAIVALAVRTAPSARHAGRSSSASPTSTSSRRRGGSRSGATTACSRRGRHDRRPAAGGRDHRRRRRRERPVDRRGPARRRRRSRRRRPARPARHRRPGVGGRPAGPRRGTSCSSARAIRTSRPPCRTCRTAASSALKPGRLSGRTPSAPTARLGPDHLRGRRSRRRCRDARSSRSRRRRRAALGEVDGTLRTRGSGRSATDEPILRYVDLSTTHIAEAAEARPAGLGADRDPRAEGRAAPLLRRPGRPADARSWRSSRASPTCRSRSRSRS